MQPLLWPQGTTQAHTTTDLDTDLEGVPEVQGGFGSMPLG